MSNKSKHRRSPGPHGSPLPVMSMQEIIEVLAGKEPPTCCPKHGAEYNAIVALVSRDANGAPCFLCTRPSTMRGVFVPSNAVRYGAAPGKRRLLFYSICTGCYVLPNREALVEQRALQDARQSRAQAKAAWN